MSFEETIERIVRMVVREELADKLSGAASWAGCVKLSEAAKLAQVSVSTIEKWGRGGLRIQHRGRVRRVDVAELRAFMARQETTPAMEAKEWAKQMLGNVTSLRRAR